MRGEGRAAVMAGSASLYRPLSYSPKMSHETPSQGQILYRHTCGCVCVCLSVCRQWGVVCVYGSAGVYMCTQLLFEYLTCVCVCVGTCLCVSVCGCLCMSLCDYVNGPVCQYACVFKSCMCELCVFGMFSTSTVYVEMKGVVSSLFHLTLDLL